MVLLGSEGVKNEEDIQGNSRPAAGRYHVSIDDVSFLYYDEDEKKNIEVEEDGQYDKIRFKFQVLAGTVPGQETREIEDNFFLTDKALPRLQRLALCIGLLHPGEQQREIHFSQAVSRQLVIEVEDNKYTNKSGREVETTQLGFMGFWSLTNQAVADVPKNQQAMQMVPQQAQQQAVPTAQEVVQQAMQPAQQAPGHQPAAHPATAPEQQVEQPAPAPAAQPAQQSGDKWGGL